MKAFTSLKIGVLGGGQLGKMLLQAAMDLNINLHILDPDKEAPCSQLTPFFTQGALQDYTTVVAFGKDLDVLTIEIEKVNTDALKHLQSKGVKVYPQPDIISMIQDKRLQKQYYKENGFPTSDFVLLDTPEDITKYAHFLPAFQKSARDGYDGRGVQKINSVSDIAHALPGAGLLEKAVAIKKEIAVTVSKNIEGVTSAFPPVELVYHEGQNLVDYLISPAEISSELAEKAKDLALALVNSLGFVGLLAVEMFIDQDDNVLINEIAPRPHNSGHQTIEANITSQYQQHLRAILNLPSGDTAIVTQAAMVNLLGEPGFEGEAHYQGIEKILSTSGVHVHLYGKKITKPFRKMGHVTITGSSREELIAKVDLVKNNCKVVSLKS
ncbi:MAG: 5-(carboxyamino)imidazole ribonucleotide synthase [Bacteroidota bacterium]